MLFDDTYKVIEAPVSSIYKEKGSKFLAFAEPVFNQADAMNIVNKYREQFHDARHHCFAWAIGPSLESQRMNDDGEPSGTAGRPIFGQILSFDLTSIVIVVVRYFGGIKLGVSGLITAYKTAAREALSSAVIITKTVNEVYEVLFDYPETNEVMRAIKENDLKIIKSEYSEKCRLLFSIRKNNAETASKQIALINNVNINYLRTE